MTKTHLVRSLAFAAALASLAGACVLDEEESILEPFENAPEDLVDEDTEVIEYDNEMVGSSSQEIRTLGYWSWGTPGNYGAPLKLGRDNDRTCFLQGVTGELEGAWQGTPASVSVYRSGGYWWLRTKAGNGSGVMGHATCIPTTNNRRFLGWAGNTSNGANTTWLRNTGSTQCFLTSVSGTTGWTSPNSYVKLRKQKIYGYGTPYNAWSLSGNLIKPQDNSSGGSAGAVCVDLWQSVGSYSWQSSQGSSGVTGKVTPTTNRVCSIHTLVGNFAADPLGWNDGAKIFPQSGWWKVFSSTGKGIRGQCLNNIRWF